MSAATARLRPASRPQAQRVSQSPQLRVIEGAQGTRSLLPLAVLMLVTLVMAIVVPMVLNVHMAQTSFAIREQQLLLNELNAQAWSMEVELNERASAPALEAAARAHGMVLGPRPGIVTLEAGTVEGGTVAQ